MRSRASPDAAVSSSTIASTVRSSAHSATMRAAVADSSSPRSGIQQELLSGQPIALQPGLAAPGGRALSRPIIARPRRGLHAVDQMPQDLRLAHQRGHTRVLQRARRRVRHHERQRLLPVAPRARHARPEVRQRLGADPRVVLLPGGDARRHEIGREHLRQRRRHRDQKRAVAAQAHVAVAREAHAGQHAAAARHLVPIQADRLREPQPQRQPAGLRTIAVVVVDAPDPGAPEGRILRFGKDDRVLDGDPRLVVVAVQHPRRELLARQLARVHQLVERMLVVVAARPLLAQARDEVVGGQHAARVRSQSQLQPVVRRPGCRRHRPRAAPALSSRRIGLVLFT